MTKMGASGVGPGTSSARYWMPVMPLRCSARTSCVGVVACRGGLVRCDAADPPRVPRAYALGERERPTRMEHGGQNE